MAPPLRLLTLPITSTFPPPAEVAASARELDAVELCLQALIAAHPDTKAEPEGAAHELRWQLNRQMVRAYLLGAMLSGMTPEVSDALLEHLSAPNVRLAAELGQP